MPRPLLQSTTLLTVCLSLATPLPTAAQGIAMSRAKATNATGIENLVLAQTCDGDPSQPDCAPAQDQAGQPVATEGEAPPPPEYGTLAEPAPEAVVPAEPPANEPAAEAAPESPPANLVPDDAEPSAPDTAEPPAPEADQAPFAETEAGAAAPAEDPSAEVVSAPDPDSPVAEAPVTETMHTDPAPDAVLTAPGEDAPTPADVLPEAAPADAAGTDSLSAETQPSPEEATETLTEPVREQSPEVIPEPTPEQAQVIETMMADPDVAAAVETLSQTIAPDVGQESGAIAAAAAAATVGGAVEVPVETTTQTLDAAATRSSAQDFASPLATTAPAAPPDDKDEDDGLSDLEKAGLLALGAVAVGMLINNNRVVAKSGDRVVVDRGDGDLAIWKDDNAILRTPGVVETTQRYSDGSTLTRLARTDGSEILTVRDATGRVIRRELLRVDGTLVPLIDDTRAYAPVVVSELPRPRLRTLNLTEDRDRAHWRALLDEAEWIDLDQRFSLAQVRDIRQVRELAPELSAGAITFATGSAAIRPEEAGKLARIGAFMRDLIDTNPSELFLVEGYTDAVGSAAYNLALSDRRAELIALALSEIFGVPAENMVVQGYGERYLKVQTQAAEPLNRRVGLRRITWLLNGV